MTVRKNAAFLSKHNSDKVLHCINSSLFIIIKFLAHLILCILHDLTHCILVDSSTVISWTSSFVILGGRVYFVAFILFLMANPVSKHCRS